MVNCCSHPSSHENRLQNWKMHGYFPFCVLTYIIYMLGHMSQESPQKVTQIPVWKADEFSTDTMCGKMKVFGGKDLKQSFGKKKKNVPSRRDAAAWENERGQIRPSQVFASSVWKECTVSVGPATGDLKGGQNQNIVVLAIRGVAWKATA